MSPRLRAVRPEDHAALLEIYAPIVRETSISFEEAVPSPAQWSSRIEEKVARWPWLVAEEDGRLMGYAYGGPHRERSAYRFSTETSVYVAEHCRRRHVGRALYAALLDLLELQGFRIALAAITLPNPASVSLHRTLGFREVGTFRRLGYKLGAWHDVGWYQRRLGPSSEEEPAPVLPWANLAEDARVRVALSSAAGIIRARVR